MGRKEKIQLRVLGEDAVLFEGPVDAVLLPSKQGELTVLPYHTPLIGVLSRGAVRVVEDGKRREITALERGILHISPKGVVVLVNA